MMFDEIMCKNNKIRCSRKEMRVFIGFAAAGGLWL
jgi:hypothetical protein